MGLAKQDVCVFNGLLLFEFNRISAYLYGCIRNLHQRRATLVEASDWAFASCQRIRANVANICDQRRPEFIPPTQLLVIGCVRTPPSLSFSFVFLSSSQLKLSLITLSRRWGDSTWRCKSKVIFSYGFVIWPICSASTCFGRDHRSVCKLKRFKSIRIIQTGNVCFSLLFSIFISSFLRLVYSRSFEIKSVKKHTNLISQRSP